MKVQWDPNTADGRVKRALRSEEKRDYYDKKHSASDGTHQRERERRKDVMFDESLAVQIYLQWIYERCVW